MGEKMNRVLICVLILLLESPAFAGTNLKEGTIEKLYDKCEGYIRTKRTVSTTVEARLRGEQESPKSCCKRIINQYPERQLGSLCLSDYYISRRDFSTAMEVLQDAKNKIGVQ